MGRAFASGLTGQTPEGVQCTLRSATAAGDAAAVAGELEQAYSGVDSQADGDTLVVEADGAMAWSIAQWAVANAKDLSVTRVDVAGKAWLRSGGNGWQDSTTADGRVRITVRQNDGGS
jgi:hypothetical protein